MMSKMKVKKDETGQLYWEFEEEAKKSGRTKGKDLKSLAFDFYIYDDKKHGGKIECRNNKKVCFFNDYKKEKKQIAELIDEQYANRYNIKALKMLS